MFTVVMPFDYDGGQQVFDFQTWQNWRSYIKQYAFNQAECNRTAEDGHVVLQTPCKEILLPI